MGEINLKNTEHNMFKFNLLSSLLFVLNNNNKDIPNVYSWQNYGSGIRILHVNAEAETLEGFRDFLFKGSKQVSNEYAAGRRFVRVVNDANVDNLFRTGSVVTNEIPGFAFYGCAGDEVADPEVVINVGELVGDSYTVTIAFPRPLPRLICPTILVCFEIFTV